MKKFVLVLIALVAILSLAGCGDNGGKNNGGTDNTTNGNGNGNGGTTEADQWLAYQFGQTIKPSSGGSGNLKTFTIRSKDTEGSKVREFNIEATYLGKENAQIATQKTVMVTSPTYSSTEENVTATLECYKVKHRVTVVQDTTGDTHPAWAEITCWIPTQDLETTSVYFWLYPKAEYLDADGKQGSWSYYVTKAMQDAADNAPDGTTILYTPVTSGESDFYGYDTEVFWGMYGWGWILFKAFSDQGSSKLEEADIHTAYGSYTCHKVDKTIGGYTFRAWDVKYTGASGTASGSWEAIFSASLPLPIYSNFANTYEGETSVLEYTLTDLKLG